MTASYGTMFVFGLLLIASWVGWGAAIERVLVGRSYADRALQAGWGLAFTVVAGGVLNLAAAISHPVILTFLAVGLVLLLWDCARRFGSSRSLMRRGIRRLSRRPALVLAGLIVGGMLLTAYAAKVCSRDYNPHDDLQAYFVFPAKMIQTGAMGPDPFSEARMLSLGGMSFLQAIVLSVADPRYYRLLEPGLCLILVVALLAGVARDARAGPWTALLVALLFLAVPPPAVNAASLVTGLVLFLTLFRSLWRAAFWTGRPIQSAVLVALTGSALCSLKTTHIPACVLIVVIAFIARWRHARPRCALVGALLLTGGLTLLFTTPWMVAAYQSNGTPLFPFLGRGFHGSAYAEGWGPYQGLTLASAARRFLASATDLRVMPLWILGGSLLILRRCRGGRGSLAAFTLAAVLSFLALAGSHRVEAVYRYSWAIVFPATLTLIVYSCRGIVSAARRSRRPSPQIVPLALAMAVFVLAHGRDARHYWSTRIQRIKISVDQSRTPGFKRGAARSDVRMQDAVPAGATVLARLRYPFVLDFTRHTILIANYPGGSSPPPGMPSFQGSEPLARYLCRQSVRYVAYSYRTEANFSREAFQHRLAPGVLPWNRAQAAYALDFQDNLLELGSSRRRIFDNGDVFVLDLGTSPEGRDLGCTAT